MIRFVVVGCGRAGARLAQLLDTQGYTVTVVDQDPDALAHVASAATITAVRGVGFDRDVLRQAGIAHADGLAAATGVDEVNVVVARLARQIFRVPRVVARIYDPRKAEIYRRLGIATVSPLAWGVDRMAEALVHSELAPVLSIGSGDVNLIVLEAPPLLVGRSVQTVTVPSEIHVTAVLRAGHAFLPEPETLIREGDILYLAVLARSTARMEALLRHG